ncbi:MAG: hypothetical protein WC634_03385 [archaeon]
MGRFFDKARRGRERAAGKRRTTRSIGEAKMRNAMFQAHEVLDKINFEDRAREIVQIYNFDKVKGASLRGKCRRMMQREMKMHLLGRITGRNNAEKQMLSLLKRASRIELGIRGYGRGQKCPIREAIELYTAALGIVEQVVHEIGEKKARKAEIPTEWLIGETIHLSSISQENPRAFVKLRTSLLSVAARMAAEKAESLKPKAGVFAHEGFNRISNAVAKALPLR